MVYALQLALPVIIIEIIVEVAVGIMMRVVPNINVFVINLQLKLFVDCCNHYNPTYDCEIYE